MQKEVDFAVQEAKAMSLSYEQSIKFIMRMANVDRDTAKRALQTPDYHVLMSQ